ncbi:MAG: hypothetical protein ACREP9_03745 [Candidatus Dormibacteraceae bacterium]
MSSIANPSGPIWGICSHGFAWVAAGTSIAFLGEAKSRTRRPSIAELRRLEHIRDLLTNSGHDASRAILGLFSTTGFTAELATVAADRRDQILLIEIEHLYDK